MLHGLGEESEVLAAEDVSAFGRVYYFKNKIIIINFWGFTWMGLEQYKSLNKFYCPLHLSLDTYTTTLHWAARLMLLALMQIIFVITETALALHYNLHGCNCN